MRVLHVNKFMYRRGGAESYMLDVAALQRAAGHDVQVWGMQHPNDPPDLPLADTFAPYVELEPAPPGALAKARAGARMIWSPASARGLGEALDRFRPDVVHAHNIYHQLSPSILRACRIRGVPVVMTLHDYKLACPSYQLLDHGNLCDACVMSGPWQAAVRRCKDGSASASALLAVESTLHRVTRAYDSVGVFISPSEFLAGVLSRAGLHEGRVRVVNHFVETDVDGTGATSVSDWVGARTAAPSIVFAGRLSREKGIDVLLEAMHEIPETVTLHVAGSGPEEKWVRELTARFAPGRVVLHGRVSKGEVQRLVGSAVASIVPSRWHENQPMTILEAFGLSTPVVSTNLGGMPELVRDGQEGRVVPAEDPSALARAVTDLIQHPRDTAAQGLRARRRAETDFSVGRHLGALGEVYETARRRVPPRPSAVTG